MFEVTLVFVDYCLLTICINLKRNYRNEFRYKPRN